MPGARREWRRRAAAAGDDLAGQDAQEALAAWKEGMEAAERAAGGRWRHRGESHKGGPPAAFA